VQQKNKKDLQMDAAVLLLDDGCLDLTGQATLKCRTLHCTASHVLGGYNVSMSHLSDATLHMSKSCNGAESSKGQSINSALYSSAHQEA
jgi:hypothetical protein